MLGKLLSMADNTSWMCILASCKQEQEVVTCLERFEGWRHQKETWVLDQACRQAASLDSISMIEIE